MLHVRWGRDARDAAHLAAALSGPREAARVASLLWRSDEGPPEPLRALHPDICASPWDDSDRAVLDFLQRGGDVEEEEGDGGTQRTLFFAAVCGNHWGAARVLAAAGAMLDVPDAIAGTCAVHVAAARGDVCMLRFLVACGADKNALTHERLTPLDLAIDQQRYDAVLFLVQCAAQVGPEPRDVWEGSGESARHALHAAAASDNADLVRALIERRFCNPLATDARTGWNAVHVACAQGSARALRVLLATRVPDLARAKVDTTGGEFDGWEPIHIAARFNRADVALELLRAGAALHGHAFSPVDLAVRSNALDAVRLFGDVARVSQRKHAAVQ
jgi:hypothetical protein